MPNRNFLPEAKLKQVRGILAGRKNRQPTLRAIAKKLHVGRETVREIANGTYRTAKSKKRKRNGESRLVPGHCDVCRCDCLMPCVACKARNYRMARSQEALR